MQKLTAKKATIIIAIDLVLSEHNFSFEEKVEKIDFYLSELSSIDYKIIQINNLNKQE